MAKKILIILPFFAFLLLYLPSAKYYFFQDDWFILNWISDSNLVSLFNLRNDIIYWRPLSAPVFFKINYHLFGLNATLFHLTVFASFLALLVAIFLLFKEITKSNKTSYLIVFLYSSSAIHFISLSWLSSASYIFGTLLFVLYLYKLVKKSDHRYESTFILILGLFFSEIVLTGPVIYLIYSKIFKHKVDSALFIHTFIVIFYIVYRFLIGSVPAIGSYSIYFDKKTISNFVWYFFWSFNIPESFIDLISHKFIGNSVNVIKQNFLTFTASASLVIIFFFQLKKQINKNGKYIIFGFCLFLIGLSPFLLIPDHVYPNYLSISLLGILLIFAYSLSKAANSFIALILMIWFLSSFLTLNYTRKTHWITNEQKISKEYVQHINNFIQDPPSGSTFVLKTPSHDYFKRNEYYFYNIDTLSLSLAGNHALRVIFNDKSVNTVYDDNYKLQDNEKTYVIIPN